MANKREKTKVDVTIIPSQDLLPTFTLDKEFYDKVRKTKSKHKPLNSFVIPPYNGRGFIVKTGQTFRVIEEEGPQVADIALWSAKNPKEIFRPEHSFLIEGWFVTANTRLWSDVPYFRPMAICIEDTVKTTGEEEGWHHHCVLGSHCTSEFLEIRSKRGGLNSCHLKMCSASNRIRIQSEPSAEFELLSQFQHCNCQSSPRPHTAPNQPSAGTNRRRLQAAAASRLPSMLSKAIDPSSASETST